MKSNVSVLVTGGGAPGIAGTIHSLRRNQDGISFRIIVTDVKERVVGELLADSFYQVSPPEQPGYVSQMLDVCAREGVDVILPQTTREIEILSGHIQTFHSRGYRVVVSAPGSIRIANDKYLVLKECEKVGIPFPRYFLIQSVGELTEAAAELGYPEEKVVVKPCVSSGMRGLRILSEEKLTLVSFLNDKPDGTFINLKTLLDIFSDGDFPPMLVTEYLPGDEYSVDGFRNGSGFVAVPRLRVAIRSGISFYNRVVLRHDLMEYCEKLAGALDLKYCFGFQFKLDSSGIPKILEVNPRVQGTMAVSCHAGFNMILAAVKEGLGEAVDLTSIRLKDNVEFMRYWGGAVRNEDGSVEKI